MEYGIQRRGIYLAPPAEADIDWLFRLFENQEIWEMFGFDEPGRWHMLRAFRAGDLVTGILHTVVPRKRVGFVIMFPPDDGRDYWEFSYAIPDLADRDAFTALSSTDAMAHYMFQHLHVLAMGWRVRSDNRAANAVVRRLGYEPAEDKMLAGHMYTFYRLSRAGWAKRRRKLDAGEASHPSGIGSVFATLAGPPYEPIIPAPSAAATSPVGAPKAKKPAASTKRGATKTASGPKVKAPAASTKRGETKTAGGAKAPAASTKRGAKKTASGAKVKAPAASTKRGETKTAGGAEAKAPAASTKRGATKSASGAKVKVPAASTKRGATKSASGAKAKAPAASTNRGAKKPASAATAKAPAARTKRGAKKTAPRAKATSSERGAR